MSENRITGVALKNGADLWRTLGSKKGGQVEPSKEESRPALENGATLWRELGKKHRPKKKEYAPQKDQESETGLYADPEGYKALPENYWAGAQDLFGKVTELQGGYKEKETALKSAQAAAEQAGKQLNYTKGVLEWAEKTYQAKPSEANAGIYNDALSRYKQQYKAYEDAYTAYSTAFEEFKPIYEGYGQAIGGYNNYIEQAKKESGINADVKTLEREIAQLESDLNRYRANARWETNAAGQAFVRSIQEKYGGEEGLEKAIADMRSRLKTAQYNQDVAGADDVGNPESDSYDPQFKQLAAKRSYSIPSYEDLIDYDERVLQSGGEAEDASYFADVLGIYLAASDDERQISVDAMNPLGQTWSKIMAQGNSGHWKHLKKNEIDVYYYHLNKSGPEAAMAYLEKKKNALQLREGQAQAENREGSTGAQLMYGVTAGLDQFASGLGAIGNALRGDDSYTPPSAVQYAAQYIREDLQETGAKLPDWLGGASIGQAAFDAITTTSNMAPSILTSVAAGMINPTLGMAAGNVMMGASAAGGAYTEAVNMGYSSKEASAYAALIGGSEVGLQYLLGGVGKLGGGAIGKGVSKLLGKVDNAFTKMARTLGKTVPGRILSQMAAEGTEEGLQEVLTPWFQNLALKTENEIELLTPEALYASLLGAITGGVFEGGQVLTDSIRHQAAQIQGGQVVQQTDGGVAALKKLAAETAETSDRAHGKMLTKQAQRVVDKTYSGENVFGKAVAGVRNLGNQGRMGRLYESISDEVYRQNRVKITDALIKEKVDSKEAKAIAEAVMDSIAGRELTEYQQELVAAARKNETVVRIVRDVMGQQQNQRINDFDMGILRGAFPENEDVSSQEVEVEAEAEEYVPVEEYEAETEEYTPYEDAEESLAARIRRGQNTEGEMTYGQYGTETAAEAGAGVSDGSSQWDDGTGAREQAGELAGSPGQTAGRNQAGADRAATGAGRRDRVSLLRKQGLIRPQSSYSLGIPGGTEQQNLLVMPEESWDAKLQAVAQRVREETGRDVTFVVGRIQIQKKKGTGYVRGVWTEDGRLIVQVDNSGATAEQIADHEIFHDKTFQTPGLHWSVRQHVIATYSEEEFRQVVNMYLDALAGLINPDGTMTEQEMIRRVEEEVLADAYSGINYKNLKVTRFTEAVRDQTQAVSQQQANGVRETTAPPVEARFSIDEIQGENAEYGQGVILDTNIFDGTPTREWGKVLGQYVYSRLAGKELTVFDDLGNPESVFIARENDRVTKDGTKNSHKVLDKLARYRGDNIKALVTVHVSELLATSQKENTTSDHNHQWLDERGWEHRKTYVQDRKGNIYEAHLNIAKGRDRNILYEINNVRLIDKKKAAHGAVPSTDNGRGSHIKSSSHAGSVPQQNQKVNGKYSADDTDAAYLEVVERGDVDAAQQMVEEAAQAAGYTIKAYHGTTSRQEKNTWNPHTRSWDTEYSRITVFKRQYEEQVGHFFNSDMDNAGGYGFDLYPVYLMLKKPLVIDCKGQNYASISYDGEEMDTYEWAAYAKKKRYDGVIFENISDGVGYDDLSRLTTDYVVFDSNRIKSAEAVVYDDDGNVIPLSRRFDSAKRDIRYSADDEVDEKPAKKSRKKVKPVAESKPILSKADLRKEVLGLFSIPNGQKQAAGIIIDSWAERLLKKGELTELDRQIFFDQMYDAGVMTVPADEYMKLGLEALYHGRIYVSDSVRYELGDGWNDLRRRAFAAGVYLTEDKTDSGIDVWNDDLSQILPGLFDSEDTDLASILEQIVQVAEEGRDEQVSLAEYTAQLAGEGYISESEYLEEMERKLDRALEIFAEKAKLENKLRDRTGEAIARERERARQRSARERLKEAERQAKERKDRKDKVDKARQKKQLQELQQKTLKALQWLNKNRYRNPEEIKAVWDEVLGDLDIYAVGAANEMNWSNKYGATWKDLAAMYMEAQDRDPNFLPSEELKRIVSRINNDKIGDMDFAALTDLYKAAVGLRTEFYNRNNVINDEMKRMFAEVYSDSKAELHSAAGGYTGSGWDKLMNLQQLTPMNVFQRMGGWDPNGAFYSMAKQLERGERDVRAFTVKANRMLEEFLNEHADWVKTADGQGKDAVWYEIEVPELLELGMGDKPIFGETKTVYMTPAQKVHMYLESKNLDNLRHMAGGRTFVDKELYSKGKRQEALAQGTTIKLAPETVKKLTADLTDEEMELAQILERFYNDFARGEINRVSNILYGYDKAMGKNYAPIFTNNNYVKSEIGVFDQTAEGVGNMKGRIQGSKNPSYNISAFDAFERSVDQTAKFVGMAIPARNWNTLLNWREDNSSMGDVITHEWGDEAKVYITDLLTELQGGHVEKKDVVSDTTEKLMSNYISSVFGANPGIVLKQLGSIPLAGAYLGMGNAPTPTQLMSIDRELIAKYTQDLDWRSMGYSMPETKQLKDNPNWTQTNKFVRFTFGGGAITAMDTWAASTLWPWAENKVSKEYADLQVGSDEFYQKVAEEFETAVSRSQSVSDQMHQSQLRKSKHPVSRMFTMFRSDSAQTYNAIRQMIGEAQYYKRTGADAEVASRARKAVGAVFCAALSNYVLTEVVNLAMNMWKHKGKDYRDEEGEITFSSVAGEMAMGMVNSFAGIMVGGEELADAVGTALTGGKWYSPESTQVSLVQDLFTLLNDTLKGVRDTVTEGCNVAANGGNVAEYFRKHGNDMLGNLKDAAEEIAGFVGGVPVSNVEAYLIGLLKKIPGFDAAYEDIFETATKGGLAEVEGKNLEVRIGHILDNRKVENSQATAKALAELYAADYAEVVPGDTPTSISIDGESHELESYQQQVYDEAWGITVGQWLDRLVESDGFKKADQKLQAKMVKNLYSYAADLAKRELFEDIDPTKRMEEIKAFEAAGLTTVDYLPVAASGIDAGDWLEYVQAGMEHQEASEILSAMDELEPLPDAEKVSNIQRWRLCVDQFSKTDVQLAALRGVMTDSQFMKVDIANDMGVEPRSFVELYELLPTYDDDQNGAYTSKEIRAAVSTMELSATQKAVLWQLATGSTSAKNNPFSKTAGEQVIAEKKVREAEDAAIEASEEEGESLSFSEQIARQWAGK